MNKIDRMRELIWQLNEATEAYDAGKPYMSDEKWDDMYFELHELEKETGIILANSPVHNIYYANKTGPLEKVTHNHPMLSLDKTKEIDDIIAFGKNHNLIAMAKMDGLTCSIRYIDGKLVSAETRGNGIVGEDITHNIIVVNGVPLTIPFKEELVVDGEVICTYENFEKFKDEYRNPRNFAAGNIRRLNTQGCTEAGLTFIAWDCIKGMEDSKTLSNKIFRLEDLGFIFIPLIGILLSSIDKDSIEYVINSIKQTAKEKSYPIDGIVFKYDNIEEYEAAGRTDHHFKGGLAYKFYDEVYETTVKNIEWSMGKTGQLTPVLIYEDINIDGTICNRASLHNISIMTQLMGGAYPGQRVYIYKANQIIPQVDSAQLDNPMKVPGIQIPKVCPYCGASTEIRKENESETLWCTNPSCSGKLINRLDHFCGKKGLDIKGLSKMTLEKLINWGWITELKDLFTLSEHKQEWINKAGFGEASVDKILNAIETSRTCTGEKFVCALGIPLIGKVASESLLRYFLTYKNLKKAIDEKSTDLYDVAGVGEVMISTLLNYDFTEADFIFDNYITEENVIYVNKEEGKLKNKVFVITGKLKKYKNRTELKAIIEKEGGKVTDSVSSKTSYLINNDINSTSSKNNKAKELGIPIITEADFVDLII